MTLKQLTKQITSLEERLRDIHIMLGKMTQAIMVQPTVPPPGGDHHPLTLMAGLWKKKRTADPVKWQRRIRSEWNQRI